VAFDEGMSIMQPINRLLLAALAATLCMGLTVGMASANKLSVSSRNFRMTWSSMEFRGSEGTTLIRCPVTFEGSFHSSTIAKVASSLVGHISRAPLASAACTTGAAEGVTLDAETLPWHVTYESFAGTLPNITRANLGFHKRQERIRVLGFVCLYQPAAAGVQDSLSVGAGGAITSTTLGSAGLLLKIQGPTPPCPQEQTDIGISNFTVQGSTTSISIRLI
jgi:hypothetical protein